MHHPLTPAHRAADAHFAQLGARVAAHAAAADRAGAVPAASWRAVVDEGYLEALRPDGVADGVVLGLAMEHLARACPSTYWTATISGLLAGRLLHELCRPAHHARWLDPLLSGEAIGAFAATEDGPGSDPASYRTTVHREGGRLVLRGAKSRISNATTADVAVVLARDGDPVGPRLCYVVLDLRRPGVTREDHPRLGLRGMSWGRLRFDDVELAEEDVLRDADVLTTLRTVEWGQLLQAWCGVGIAERALTELAAYAAGRVAFGRPLAALERVSTRAAELRAEIDGVRLLARDATVRKVRGEDARALVMLAKVRATDLAVQAADVAMRTLGGWGFSADFPVERLYRDALANVPAGLPNDRLQELLACGMLGEDPWSYPDIPALASP